MFSLDIGIKNYEIILKVGITAAERMIKSKIKISFICTSKHQSIPLTIQETTDYCLLKNIIDQSKDLEFELLEQFAEQWINQAEKQIKNISTLTLTMEKIDAPIARLNKCIPFLKIEKHL